jgi:hypothetical protein
VGVAVSVARTQEYIPFTCRTIHEIRSSDSEFLSNWHGLAERIRTTMPANRPGMLRGYQNADILAYLLQGNQFPYGVVKLPRQTEILSPVRCESEKPATKK